LPGFPIKVRGSGHFTIAGQAMEHESQGLRMHQAVLDAGFDHFQQIRGARARLRERHLNSGIKLCAQFGVVRIDLFTAGPFGRLVAGQTPVDGINSKGKQVVKRFIKRLKSESAFPEEIPVESFHMAQIKNDAVAFRYRAIVHGFSTDYGEKVIGLLASLLQAQRKLMRDFADRSGQGFHEVSPYGWMPCVGQRCIEGSLRSLRTVATRRDPHFH
jgi:hypothetical protein